MGRRVTLPLITMISDMPHGAFGKRSRTLIWACPGVFVLVLPEANSAPQLPTGDDTVCEIDDDVVLFPNSDVTQARVRAKMLAA